MLKPHLLACLPLQCRAPKPVRSFFVYRGADAIEKNFITGIKDWFMDLKIAVGENLKVDDGKNQFVDAFKLYIGQKESSYV